jgi:hypothetical protein
MKVKQIVGEHKKGVRARKYPVKGPGPRKPTNVVDPKKALTPVKPVAETMDQFGKVTGVTPDGKVTIAPNDPNSGGPITMDKTALLPGAQPNTVSINPDAAQGDLKPGTQVTTSTEQAVGEGGMDELAADLGQIADEEDYDRLYDLLSDDGPIGKYLHSEIEDITAETGMHPKDDFERIEQMLMDRVQSQFGSQHDDEGGETDDAYAMASAGFGSDEDYGVGESQFTPDQVKGFQDTLANNRATANDIVAGKLPAQSTPGQMTGPERAAAIARAFGKQSQGGKPAAITNEKEMEDVQSPFPSRNDSTQVAEPAKPVQSAVYPSRNTVKEDDALLEKMRAIAGLR